MKTSVGVLIVNWNSGGLLRRCLDALAAQTVQARRVLVIDNASGDGSEQAAEGREGVELLRMSENLGFARGNNLGVERLSDCEWIALLNPDAFAEPEWLESLLVATRRNPEIRSFASRQLLADTPSVLDGAGDVYSVAGLAWRRHHGREAAQVGLADEQVFGPCGAAALYRRDAFLEVGGFDDTYFCYFEDVDLAFRLRLRGYSSLYVANAVVHHVGSALTGVRSDFAVFHGHRNLVWTFFKNMPAPMLVQYLPHHLLLNLVSLLVLVARGQAVTGFRSKWAALLGLRAALRARRAVQRRRRASSRDLRAAMTRGLGAFGVGRRG